MRTRVHLVAAAVCLLLVAWVLPAPAPNAAAVTGQIAYDRWLANDASQAARSASRAAAGREMVAGPEWR
jgi:hypothetical protein